MKPREYTKDEVLYLFCQKINDTIDDLEKTDTHCGKPFTTRNKLETLAHSMMATIAGCSIDLPAFILAPIPSDEDKAFHKKEGSNWFPENHKVESKIKSDIGEGIHQILFHYKKLDVDFSKL